VNIFFSSDISGSDFFLTPEESLHCIKVLRMRKGEPVCVIDGKGTIADCEIVDENPKKCKLKVIDIQIQGKRKEIELTIAIAPTKSNERFEMFLEKSCEIGVDNIIPLLCEHSERKVINRERFLKLSVSAIKQSKSGFLPHLSEMIKFQDLIKKDFEGEKYIAHCFASEQKKHIKECYLKGKNILILIGPEGDFSEEEVKIAVSNGFKEVSLSGSRLRTETAGIVACQIIDCMNS
jgi:16S rRNA (uracil1498-N3)-methyltransferase